MNWINYPLVLRGKCIDLVSLDQRHFEELERIAKDKRIWEFYVYDGSNATKFQEIFSMALKERDEKGQFPFAIFHRGQGRIIGSTRFMDRQPKHRKLEIGSTWLDPACWGTTINLECKMLLLTYCFETLRTMRVQLKTDVNNMRSRKAIEKIGGRFEGILRNDMIRDNETNRNSALYSIIAGEWPEAKRKLSERIDGNGSAPVVPG